MLEGLLEAWDGEEAVVHFDQPTGAWIFLAIHSRLRGPACGGTRMKPVGTVHIATARSNQGLMHREEFFQLPEREDIQLAAVQSALQALRDRIS